MKGILLLLAGAFSIYSAFSQTPNLDQLVYNKQFPLLKQQLEQPEYKKLSQRNVYQAILLNAFGQNNPSNEIISKISLQKIVVPDSLRFYLMQAQYNNYVALSDYKNAYSSGTALLSEFPAFFDSAALADEQEALKIWKGLRSAAPQKVIKLKDTRIPVKRDLAGLWNVPVTVNGFTEDFIFDSGAGISTITESYARKLGLIICDSSVIEVTSGITGISNKVRIGSAQKMSIGNVLVSRAVFLIMPDSALSFADGAYKINGIIGFPVISQLGSFTITEHELMVRVKDTNKNIEPNMSVEQLSPVIYLSYEGTLLPFTFDTGAQTTNLSDVFYERYKEAVDRNGRLKEVNVGGAGGTKKMNVVEIPELHLAHYKKDIVLLNAQVSKDMLPANKSSYYGNIGQDVIKQFSSMTINFRQSYILFE